MTASGLDLVFIGLTLSSAWGNGHATTYRSLLKGLARRGHRISFLERDRPWYAAHRDLAEPDYCELALYSSTAELYQRHAQCVARADAVIVGSYVDDGIRVLDWVFDTAQGLSAFYDIDTPVTLASLAAGECEYLQRDQIPELDLLLSFSGGPTLQYLETQLGARCAQPLYCSVDVDEYQPCALRKDLDLGYMGTYSADRQPGLESLLLEPARCLPDMRFAVAGAQYPSSIEWPANVQRSAHCPPNEHARFYGRQRFTLNLTRAEMRRRGFSPSVRLFEAAACATAIISDDWPGLAQLFVPEEQIIIAGSTGEVRERLEWTSDLELQRLARGAREQVLLAHSGVQRAQELEAHLATACSHAVLRSRRYVGTTPASVMRAP